jgi:hypothetical protein
MGVGMDFFFLISFWRRREQILASLPAPRAM